MHMKKKVLLLSSVLLILIIIVSIVFIINKSNTNGLVLENKEEAKEQITGSNWLSMMYETGPGTGEYSESKSSLWPESGYIFNENLSGCENGGELSWNDDLGAVTLHSNKSDSCYVYFDAYIIPVINSVTTSNIETDSITLTVNVTNGNNPVTTYYYSNNNGSSYVSSNNNTYTFSGLDMGTVYNFCVYAEDSVGYVSEIYNLSETTDDVLLLADWVISQYGGVQGNNGIYYHTSSLVNSAGDNSYRYSGANPNNYVCFGSDAATCPEDNLYRIIGVFENKVKLIKNTSIGNYVWSGSSSNRSNIWSDSTLNTEILNGTYLNNFLSIWQDKISTHIWKVGGITSSNGINTPRTAYNYEEGSNSSSTIYNAKIGLMYISDYGFAASPANWTTILHDYDNDTNTSNNYLFVGLYEWTISRNTTEMANSFYVSNSGSIGFIFAFSNPPSLDSAITRPVFYLTSDTQYASGIGTSSDPIRLS